MTYFLRSIICVGIFSIGKGDGIEIIAVVSGFNPINSQNIFLFKIVADINSILSPI